MRYVIFLMICIFTATCYAQKQYKVFDWKPEQTFNTWLLQRIHRQYEERRKDLREALTSPGSLRAYQERCRVRYKKLVGMLPAKTDLKPAVTGTLRAKGFTIEKVIYESIPNHHVTANLYLPDGKGPFPAVLLFCGHEPQSKATASYQKTAILFALNGFVVFVIDPISQGERHQLADEDGKPLVRGGTTEHTLINAAATLAGSSAVAYELWDNIRGLDYLLTRKEVDAGRVGCVGNSGGGTQVSYFMGFDERIKVAAPCSYIASRERNFDLIGGNDGCQHIPGEGAAGLEISDFLIMGAPKPLLILAGRYDFVDYTGTLQAYRELKDVYAALGQRDKVRLFTAEDGHGISKPKREAVVTWFRKWLYNDSSSVKENGLTVLPVESLLCTSSGEVNTAFPGEINDFQRTEAIADELEASRHKKINDLDSTIMNALNIKANHAKVTAEETGRIEEEDYTIHKVIVRQEGEMLLPVLTVYPSRPVKQVVLWLSDHGKQNIADSALLIKKYRGEDAAIVMADLAGFGEIADPEKFNDPKYYNKEYRNAIAAIHTGSSLPAERVRNIMVLLDFISGEERLQKRPIVVYAYGKAAVPALHAAVIDSRISKIKILNTISSFEEVLQNPAAKDRYAYVIPGVLKYYDIPDLRKALGERLME